MSRTATLLTLGALGVLGVVMGLHFVVQPHAGHDHRDHSLPQPASHASAAPGSVRGARLDRLTASVPMAVAQSNGESAAAAEQMALRIDAHCGARSGLDDRLGAEENIRQRLSIRLDGKLEEALFFTERSLFWQFDQHHYQVTASWERDQPARYRMEFYRSDDPFFESGVQPEPLPAMPAEGIDALSATEMQDALLEDFVKRGAQPSGKVLIVRAIDQQAREMHEFTLFDERLLNWSFPQGTCLRDEGGTALDCECQEHDHHHGHAH